MTDMVVSFLFIVLILLAFFAIQFKPDDVVPKSEYEAVRKENVRLTDKIDELEERIRKLLAEIERLKQDQTVDKKLSEYLRSIAQERQFILSAIQKHVERETGLRVTIDNVNGIIRFRGDDLFGSAAWRVQKGSTADRVAAAIADAFSTVLPCYTVGTRSKFDEACNNSSAIIEAIQIEGHTDDDAVSARLTKSEGILDNLDLSARRGAEMFRAILMHDGGAMLDYLNIRGQPVLSFSGYGDMRPLEPHKNKGADRLNRRIDLRFILTTPIAANEVDAIKSSLVSGAPDIDSRIVK